MTQLTSTILRFVGSPPSNAAVSITTTTAPDIVAPAGVFFEATVTDFPVGGPAVGRVYDPRFHEIHYKWEFDDPGSYAAPVNLPAGWNDRNVKYGPDVGHIFRNPGTYTVRCTATHWTSGTSATTTTQVVVADPDTLYSGNRTILVDPANVGDSTTYPSSQVRTTIDSALTAARNLSSSCRVLLKKGVEYNDDVRLRSGYTNHILIGAWGVGTPPKMIVLSSLGQITIDNDFDAAVTVSGLDFEGDYSALTETGTLPHNCFSKINENNVFYVVFDCRMSNTGAGIRIGGGTGAVAIVEDVSIEEWQDYGVFGAFGQGKASIAGLKCTQNPAGMGGGGGGKDGIFEDRVHHGPIRCSDNSGTAYFGILDLYCNNDWSSTPPLVQPGMRLNQNAKPEPRIFVDRLVSEGSESVALNASDGNPPPGTDIGSIGPGNIVVDKMLAIGGYGNGSFVRIEMGGTTIRNSLFIQPNVKRVAGEFRRVLTQKANPNNDIALNPAEPVAVYGCTLVNLANAANGGRDTEFDGPAGAGWPGFGPLSSYFTDLTIENNVRHIPNIGSPVTADAPLDTTELFDARNVSYQWADALTPDTSFATPDGSVADFRPQVGSAAIGDATTGLVPYDDFYGTVRGPNPSRGAVEPG